MRDIIEVEKDLMPYNFDILLEQEEFNLYIMYNSVSDSFTVTLSKDGVVLVDNEPVIYGVPLFQDVYGENFPCVDIVPLDESGETNVVNWETFGKTVFLTIDNMGDEEELVKQVNENDSVSFAVGDKAYEGKNYNELLDKRLDGVL